jgi:hypothetical protein
LLIRKSGDHSWTDFERFAIVAAPAGLLYVLALAGTSPFARQAAPWQTVLGVTAILLAPLALFALLRWAGANTGHVLYDAGVFALTGIFAGYITRRARVSYTALLGAISLLIAWLLLWDKLLGHPSADTFRWLLVAGAAVLLLVAVALAVIDAVGAAEVATAGGLAAVAAGVFGVIVGAFVGLFRMLVGSAFTSSPAVTSGTLPGGRPGLGRFPHEAAPVIHTSGVQHFGWDLYLLVASLALVWMGSRMRVRGLGYVGAVGLLALVVSVGAQITRVETGRPPNHGVTWPLVLIIVGAAALVVSLPVRRR